MRKIQLPDFKVTVLDWEHILIYNITDSVFSNLSAGHGTVTSVVRGMDINQKSNIIHFKREIWCLWENVHSTELEMKSETDKGINNRHSSQVWNRHVTSGSRILSQQCATGNQIKEEKGQQLGSHIKILCKKVRKYRNEKVNSTCIRWTAQTYSTHTMLNCFIILLQ